MICKNCGNPVADDAKFCTKCGQRVVAEVQEEVKETITEVQEEVKETVAEVQEEVKETITEVQEEVKESVNVASAEVNAFAMTDVPTVNNAMPETEKKEKKSFYKALIPIAVIVVLLVVVLANFKTLANTMYKLVLSPEKYYVQVEKAGIKELSASIADSYSNAVLANGEIGDYSVEYGMELELGEDAYKLLANTLDMDDHEAKNLSKMAIDFLLSNKGDMISAEVAGKLGKTQLISANAVADIKKEEAYAQIPELTDKYIGVSIEDYVETFEEALELGEEYQKLYPDKNTVEKLLNRYLTIVVENINNVSEKSDTISVGDIEQKCTAIRVRIKEEDAFNIAKAVCEEAVEDTELIEMVAAYGVVLNDMDEEEAKDAVEEAIESALAEIEEYEENVGEGESSDEELIMNVWVDNKGEVIGRELIVEEETIFIYQMPQKGGKFELEAKFGDGYDYVIFEGSGKKSASSLTGEFVVKLQEYDEKPIKFLKIAVDRFNTKKIKEGFIDGTFRFSIAEELWNEAGGGIIGTMFYDYQIVCDIETSKSAANMSIALNDGDEMFAKINLSVKIGSGKSASLPSKGILVEDEEDIMEWAESIDFGKFLKNISKSGLPEELVDLIEEACDELEDMIDSY